MRRKIDKNNKGSSIVLVLLAVAFIGILAAIILMMSLLNFKMKAIDSRSIDTFYDAETALDEIKAGLQSEIANAYTEAYVDVLQQYTANSEDERRSLFQKEYVYGLKQLIEDSDNTAELVYDMSNETGLGSYITPERLYVDDTNNDKEDGVGVILSTIKEKDSVTGEEKEMNPILAQTVNGLVLKNLIVTYYNEKHFKSQVQTDILLRIPDINFTQTTNAPNLLEYAIVADDTFSTMAGEQAISGSLYGGRNGMTVGINSVLDVKKCRYLVTSENIEVRQGAQLTTDSSTGLWSRSIDVVSGKLDIDGVTHVSNDLLVDDAAGGESNLTFRGEYYGFGNPDTVLQSQYIKENVSEADVVAKNPAKYSSAMLLNGQNIYMDLTGLKRLMLAGNSYVGVTNKNDALNKANTGKQNTSDVRMGESLTVKSNQIAYLVPPKLVGVRSANGGQNPMTLTQYNKLASDMGGEDQLVSQADLEKETGTTQYTTAYYPVNGETMVYLYLKFDNADEVASYFRKYYANNEKKISKYLKFYTTGIKLGKDSSTTFNLFGNSMKYEEDKVSVRPESNEADTQQVLAARQANMQDMYAALKIKLVTNYLGLTANEKDLNNVYENLIRSDLMANVVGQYGQGVSGGKTAYQIDTENSNLTGVMSTSANITVKAGNRGEVVNNSNCITNVDANNVTVYVGDENSVDAKKVRVIITTGNVTIDSDCHFHGLIIAKGNVVMGSGSSITAEATDVAKVLQAEKDELDGGKIRIMDYLKDAESYLIGGAINGTVSEDETESNTAVSDLIEYRHWKKQ